MHFCIQSHCQWQQDWWVGSVHSGCCGHWLHALGFVCSFLCCWVYCVGLWLRRMCWKWNQSNLWDLNDLLSLLESFGSMNAGGVSTYDQKGHHGGWQKLWHVYRNQHRLKYHMLLGISSTCQNMSRLNDWLLGLFIESMWDTQWGRVLTHPVLHLIDEAEMLRAAYTCKIFKLLQQNKTVHQIHHCRKNLLTLTPLLEKPHFIVWDLEFYA